MIYIEIKGITQYGNETLNPVKYFRTISPYDKDKPELVEQLEREIREEYERDKQDEEREQVRKEAQYLQDLETISRKNRGNFENRNTSSIAEKAEFVTSEQLQRFWDIPSERRKYVVNAIFQECRFQPQSDLLPPFSTVHI